MLELHVKKPVELIFGANLMRVIAEIPHSHFKIQIFNWNSKYILKFEIDKYEQTYKINESDVSGVESVKALVTAEFLEQVMSRMVDMRTQWQTSLKSI